MAKWKVLITEVVEHEIEVNAPPSPYPFEQARTAVWEAFQRFQKERNTRLNLECAYRGENRMYFDREQGRL
jgi:hypothetical protein